MFVSQKKGVSPVIATILLVAIVVVLSGIIFIWAKGFLSESATKGDRVVESSCEDVKFEVQIVESADECGDESAVDVNNIGNIPIHGVKVLQYDDSSGSIENVPIADDAFTVGTIKVGQSSYACLNIDVNVNDKFRIIPKLLAEKDERKIAYTCPEKDGITVVYTG